MFGPHLVLEGYGCDKKTLADVGYLYHILDVYPDMIGMRKIMPPHIQQYLEKPNADWGLSGFVIIAESHIAIHTYPEKGFVALDIFSCKDFSVQEAIDFIVEKFSIQKCDHKVFSRGADYPKNIKKSISLVSSHRNKISAVAHASR